MPPRWPFLASSLCQVNTREALKLFLALLFVAGCMSSEIMTWCVGEARQRRGSVRRGGGVELSCLMKEGGTKIAAAWWQHTGGPTGTEGVK